MGCFLKTCLGHTFMLAALSIPVFGVGCERQSDPPVTPRSGPATLAVPPGEPPPGAAAQPQKLSMDDGAITARVKTALLADEVVKAFAIDVDTREGKVTLKGVLQSDEQVRQAVEVARDVDGVREVVNRLSVKAEDNAARSTQG